MSFLDKEFLPWTIKWVFQRIIIIFLERRLPQFEFINEIKRKFNKVRNMPDSLYTRSLEIDKTKDLPSLEEIRPYNNHWKKENIIGNEQTVVISLISKEGKYLERFIKSVIEKVNFINVFLINYQEIPCYLEHPKINYELSSSFKDIGVNGKFHWSDNILGYHFICDERLVLPDNFFSLIIERLSFYNNQVVLGFEGKNLKRPFITYNQDTFSINATNCKERDLPVQILNTDIIAYHASAINVSRHFFFQEDLIDLWFALIGQRQKVPFICSSIFDFSDFYEIQRYSINDKQASFLIKSNLPFFTNFPNDKPIVLLSVTTYNRADYFRDFYDSWEKTRDRDTFYWRLVVADDGSKDDTINVINNIEPTFDLHLIENNRKGAVGQTNSIFQLSDLVDFNYGFKADDDLIFTKIGWDHLYIEAIKNSPYKHICYSNLKQIYKALKNTSINEKELGNNLSPIYDTSGLLESYSSVSHAMGCFFSFDKEIIAQVGACDEENFKVRGEWHIDFSTRCCRAGFNNLDSFYDVKGSEEYITLQNFLDEDSYYCSISWDEYKHLRTKEELSRRKTIIDNPTRVFIPLNRKEDKITPNEFFDKIWVINLDRSVERYRKIRVIAENFNLDIEKFEAVDGNLPEVAAEWEQYKNKESLKEIIPIEFTKKYYLSYHNYQDRISFLEKRMGRKALTKGAYGYAKSYINILKKAIENDYDRILVLDDDIVLHKNFNQLFSDSFLSLPDDWMVVLLGAMQYNWDEWITPYNQYFYHCNGSSVATHACAISKKSFLPLLHMSKKLDLPIDEGAFTHIQRTFPFKCFVNYPNLMIQDVSDSEISSSKSQGKEGQKINNVYKWDLNEYDFEVFQRKKIEEIDILYIIESFPNIPETFILNEVLNFLKEGKKILIISLKDSRWQKLVHDDVYKYDLYQYVVRLEDYKNKLSSKEKTIRGLSNLLFSKRFGFTEKSKYFRYFFSNKEHRLPYLFHFMKVLDVLDKVQPKNIYCHFGNIGNIFIPLKGMYNVKFITYFHGYDYSQLPKKGIDYRHLFKFGDVFFTNSSYTMSKVIGLGCPNEKVKKVGYAINPNAIKFKVRNSKRLNCVKILTVARLVEKKGLKYSIEAIAKLIKKGYKIEYNIIGEGRMRKELQERIVNLKIENYVNFLGKKTSREVFDYMHKSSLFILSSVTAESGDTEGLGVVLLEAQLSGMPVIATKHNGFTDSVLDGKSGFLVPERDSDAIADKIRFLLENPDKWAEMGRVGRRHIMSNYSPSIVLEKIEKSILS